MVDVRLEHRSIYFQSNAFSFEKKGVVMQITSYVSSTRGCYGNSRKAKY